MAPHLAIVRWAARGPSLDRGFDQLTPERRALWRQAVAGFPSDEVAASRKALRHPATPIAQDLERGLWLAGDAYTIADAGVFPHVHQFPALGINLPTVVEEWRARIAERPAVQSAIDAIESVPTVGPERGRWG
jgi:glutathione S-transferase